MTRLIVFDCDGTLVDSQHLIIDAMRTTFAARKSNWLMRSPYIVPGSTRFTMTFAAPPESGRPSDGATTAFGTL